MVDPAGIELTTFRLRRHHQLPVVQLIRFMPPELRKKTPQNNPNGRGDIGQLTIHLNALYFYPSD